MRIVKLKDAKGQLVAPYVKNILQKMPTQQQEEQLVGSTILYMGQHKSQQDFVNGHLYTCSKQIQGQNILYIWEDVTPLSQFEVGKVSTGKDPSVNITQEQQGKFKLDVTFPQSTGSNNKVTIDTDYTITSDNLWVICTKSDITVTLPKGNQGMYMKISTDSKSSNIKIKPFQQDSIEADSQGLLLDDVNSSVSLVWINNTWNIIEAI